MAQTSRLKVEEQKRNENRNGENVWKSCDDNNEAESVFGKPTRDRGLVHIKAAKLFLAHMPRGILLFYLKHNRALEKTQDKQFAIEYWMM